MSELKAAGYKLHGRMVNTRKLRIRCEDSDTRTERVQTFYILHAIHPHGRKVRLCRTVTFTEYCGKVQQWLDATEGCK